jgi:uncharacterized protein YicC (UPF0701 family)
MSKTKPFPMGKNSGNALPFQKDSESKSNGSLDELSRVRDIILGQYKEEQSLRQSNLEALFQSHLTDIKDDSQKQMQDLKKYAEDALSKLSDSFEQLSSTVQELKASQEEGKRELGEQIDTLSKNHSERLEQESTRMKEKFEASFQQLTNEKVNKDKLAEVFSKLAGILTDPK